MHEFDQKVVSSKAPLINITRSTKVIKLTFHFHNIFLNMNEKS